MLLLFKLFKTAKQAQDSVTLYKYFKPISIEMTRIVILVQFFLGIAIANIYCAGLSSVLLETRAADEFLLKRTF